MKFGLKITTMSGYVALCSLVCLFFSCTKEYSSYGVVLWSAAENAVPSGSLIGIIQKSQIQNNVQGVILDNGKAVGAPIAIPAWRLQEFSSNDDAERYRKLQAQWLKEMGVSTRLALPIRVKAEKNADVSYRLRLGETVKIITRSEKTAMDGATEAYWYQVLTKDGTQGWVFGTGLTMFSLGEAVATTGNNSQFSASDVLARLNTSVWRPESFPQMVQNDRYDLNEFAVEYGFFIDTSSKTVRVSTAKTTYEGAWTSIVPAADNGFLFDGVKITGRFVDQIKLEVSFLSDNVEQKLVFVPFNQELQSLIGNELARRQAIIRNLSFSGAELSNEQFGTIRFRGSSFEWNGFGAVQPGIIPAGATNGGKYKQDVYLTGEAASAFQGVIGLLFNGTAPDQIAYFAFAVLPNGVRLQALPAANLKDLAFETVPTDSPAMVFVRR